MEFEVLGTLSVREGDRVYTPSAPKLRRVLTMLLVQANRAVLTDHLTEELWQHTPPPSALATLQTYIYQLRKVLEAESHGSAEIVTLPFGYMLGVDPDRIDLFRFERLISQGRREFAENRLDSAARLLRQALDLWKGPIIGGVYCGPILQAHAVRVEEIRIDALRLRIEADLAAGLHHELISELKSLIATYPLHEWFYTHLMKALHRCSRRGEALEVYRRYRRTLVDELGLEPDVSMQQVHQEILTDGMRL